MAVTGPGEADVITVSPVRPEAIASDNERVTLVEFFAQRVVSGGQEKVGEDSSSPYQALWSPTCNALWRLFARAHDACGNAGVSAQRTVTVNVAGLALCP